jgi:hypothetical protein
VLLSWESADFIDPSAFDSFDQQGRGARIRLPRQREGRMTLRLSMLVFFLCLSGCEMAEQRPASEQNGKQQKLADLNRQKADAVYEIQLRQDEMTEMERTARKPGVIGVGNQWLERHNRLKEEIIKLKVKFHDLELQIDNLAKQ